MSDPSDHYEVIIIGAGISGMVAAYTILNKVPTLNILVLEAKDRVGGRTLSAEVKGRRNQIVTFDIGAQWVSSSQKHLIDLIESLQLKLVHQQRTGITLGEIDFGAFEGYTTDPIIGSAYTKYELTKFFRLLEEKSTYYSFLDVENKFTEDLYDTITMENFICTQLWSNCAQEIAKNIIRTSCGVEPSQISVLYYLLFCNSMLGFSNQYMKYDGGAKEFWIKEGAQEICKQIHSYIGQNTVVLDDPIIEVDQSNNLYVNVVTLSGKKYRCYYLISTVPPEQVLKIKFKPSLTRIRKHVLEQFQIGHVVKFIITYERTFWRENGYSGDIFSWNEGPINICYDVTKAGNPAIAGYIKEPSKFEPDRNGTFKSQVIQQLVKHWGKEASKPIDYVEKSWWDEEYVGGCPMTCPGLGTMKWFHTLSQPYGRIIFAGAEMATQWNGYMNGAVQSGYKAAVSCLTLIRPQTILYKDIQYINIKNNYLPRLKAPDYFNKFTITGFILIGILCYKYLRLKHVKNIFKL